MHHEKSSLVFEEYRNFEDKQYAGKSREERQKLGAFFTPPELSLKILSKLHLEKGKTLLDPACGAGGLLAAAIIMEYVNPEDCYGIEIDEDLCKVCRRRLSSFGVPEENIQTGDAMKIDLYMSKTPWGWWTEEKIQQF